VALRNGEVSSFPLAGSCPRGIDDEEDERLIAALKLDESELAEHDMQVDLALNDIGRVSRLGSVRIREYREVRRHFQASYLSSYITGELRDDADAFDVLAATFPAGTLSGVPRRRAVEIIDTTEGIRRGVYGGAIGYIDFTGNMDMCIGHRMAVLKSGFVHAQAGARVMADTAPETQYLASLNKAKVIMEALDMGGRGEA
jgi:anthranilate synthase component 1